MNHSLQYHFVEKKRKGEGLCDVPLTETARVCWCYKLLCYFSVLSLKYSVSPLSSPRLTKHTMATEQPWIHSAILPSSRRTEGRLEERKKEQERRDERRGGQPLTQEVQVQSRTIRSSPLVHVGVAACSTNLILCKPICQMPHVNSFLLLCECVYASEKTCASVPLVCVWERERIF